MNIDDIKNAMIGREPGIIGGQGYCSVMMLLAEKGGGTQDGHMQSGSQNSLHIVYERRAEKLRTQPGDICFPGGSMEEDETPLECALRETWEEIGIPAERIEVLGQFDSMHLISGVTMYTFVGVISEETLDQAKINEDEVSEVFTVPLEFFEKEMPMMYKSEVVQTVDDFPYEETGIRPDYRWRRGKNDIPIYRYEDRVIWGLTARITMWFVQCFSKIGG